MKDNEEKQIPAGGPIFKAGMGIFALCWIVGMGLLMAWLVFGGGWRTLFGAFIPWLR